MKKLDLLWREEFNRSRWNGKFYTVFEDAYRAGFLKALQLAAAKVEIREGVDYDIPEIADEQE